MKRRTIFGGLLGATFAGISVVSPAFGQKNKEPDKMHRVAFDVSMEGEDNWEAMLRNVENVRASLGDESTTVEVVVHGKALPLLEKTSATFAEKLQSLAKNGVRLAACKNTMKRMKVTREMLFPFVTTVDAGVGELVRLQEDGWSYIKGGG